MSARVSFNFSNLAELAEKLENLEGDVKKATAEALEESQKYIAQKLHTDMAKHKLTGKTEASIIAGEMTEWEGTTAGIDVGFRIRESGSKLRFVSIYLMYGTPRMKKDQKLYNDIYGSRTKKELKRIQEEKFQKAIRERMG